MLAVVSADGRSHRVQLTAPAADGARRLLTATVPGTGRVVIDVAKAAAGTDLALLLRADGPVVVERESAGPGLTRSHAVPG